MSFVTFYLERFAFAKSTMICEIKRSKRPEIFSSFGKIAFIARSHEKSFTLEEILDQVNLLDNCKVDDETLLG